jgi:hypothetical protein
MLGLSNAFANPHKSPKPGGIRRSLDQAPEAAICGDSHEQNRQIWAIPSGDLPRISANPFGGRSSEEIRKGC